MIAVSSAASCKRSDMQTCMECEKPLGADEIAIYRKLIFRDAEDYLCKACLAKKMRVSEQSIDEKIAHFKKIGCTLFS